MRTQYIGTGIYTRVTKSVWKGKYNDVYTEHGITLHTSQRFRRGMYLYVIEFAPGRGTQITKLTAKQYRYLIEERECLLDFNRLKSFLK